MKLFHYFLVVLCSFGLISCQKESSQAEQVKNNSDELDPVLVRVNAEDIHQSELDVAVLAMLGPQQSSRIDDAGRKKILQSLVISRLVSQEANKNLSEEDKKYIAIKVARYREELLVKQYLRDNVEPKPITQEMVEQYYQVHIADFTEESVREYCLITTKASVSAIEREELLKLFSQAEKQNDWSSLVKQWKANGIEVELRTGRSDEKLLQIKLRNMLQGLNQGEGSKPFMLNGKPYVVKVVKVKHGQVKPIAKVAKDIRVRLLKEQLKTSVASVKENLKKVTKIEYLSQ